MIILNFIKGIFKAILIVPIYLIDGILNLGADQYTAYTLLDDFING